MKKFIYKTRHISLTFTFVVFIFSYQPSLGQIFERVTDVSNPILNVQMPSENAGAAWIDYNNDGLIDLFVTDNNLFKNIGEGNFEIIETDIGLNGFIPGRSYGVTWSDYDNDGDNDLFMTGNHSALFENVGNDSFERVNTGHLGKNEDLRGWTASWGDYDADGYSDLIVTHHWFLNGPNPIHNIVFNNNGGFLVRDYSTPLTEEISSYFVPSFIDYDLDGDLDLFIGTAPPGDISTDRDYIFKNELSQTGMFEYERINDELFATELNDGIAWNFIDYDNDGDLDGFLSNYRSKINKFYQNDDGVYSSIPNELTIEGGHQGNTWGDIDNDGDLDVFLSADDNSGGLYLNNEDRSFTIHNDMSNLSSQSGIFADYDNDGDLDLFLTGDDPSLYKNITNNENNWILLNLEGTVSNRSALNTKVKIKANISGNDVWQIREVSAQNSFNGHNSLRVHFGLKEASTIDSIVIMWPSSSDQVLEDVAVNQIHNFIEPIPDNFLRANFKTETTFGFGLPTLQFTDFSLSDPNNPITTWKWDFDNDGVVDATDQNPTMLYDSLGEYSVKLSISNGSETTERIKVNYIKLIRQPGIPILTNLTPIFIDTLVAKGTNIEFSAAAIDTSEYELTYYWNLNAESDGSDSVYNYRASPFLPTPRVDSLILTVSNGFNTTTNRWDIRVEEITDVEDEEGLPLTYQLNQNYPNPFNPSTFIKYELPNPGFVILKVYDLLGKEVTTLVNERQNSGYYTVSFEGSSISNGVYFYKLQAGSFVQTKKMLLVK